MPQSPSCRRARPAATTTASGSRRAPPSSELQFWRGATRESVATSTEALNQLPRGTRAWFDAAGTAITAAGQLGDHAALRALSERVTATSPSTAEAEQARVTAACRALSQLLMFDPMGEAVRELERAANAVPLAALGPEARAWRNRTDSVRLVNRNVDRTVEAATAAHRAHVEEGDLRSAALLGIHLCSHYVWTGMMERAREVIDDALRLVRRLSVDYLILWAAYAEAKLLTETPPYAEAKTALERVVEGAAGSPRIRACALIYSALSAARAGEHAVAIECAAQARAAHGAKLIQLAAAACAVRGLLGLGKREEAESLARTLEAHASGQERLSEFDKLVRLAWAESAALQGTQNEEARRAIAAAAAAIQAHADTISDPLRRNQYLVRPHLVVRTLALANAIADTQR